MKTLFTILLALMVSPLFAQTKVATVKMLRGNVDVLTLGKTAKLKVNDWVEQGAVIKTSDKSFVKLILIDNSQVNVGPNSEMKIETFTGKDTGVIDLVKGKIRSQVTKGSFNDKSKIIIKTQNAVMGVRGTDFLISYNGVATSTVLFEGEIVFNKLPDIGLSTSTQELEDAVKKGVNIFPGEFSVQESMRIMPTVPALLNTLQREQLEKNSDFETNRNPSNASGNDQVKSIVPEGLSGKVVANESQSLKKEVETIVKAEDKKASPASNDPQGYVKGDLIKPANGSFIHIDTGVIIPPGPDSVLDANSNTFIPGQSDGKVAVDGTYIPPNNVEITNDGKILVAVTGANGDTIIQEVQKPVPVYTETSVSIGQVSEVLSSNTALLNPTAPVSNDILNSAFVQDGISSLSQDSKATLENKSAPPVPLTDKKVNGTIIVNPQ